MKSIMDCNDVQNWSTRIMLGDLKEALL